MSKDDIIGIFGAALSSVFATLGFLWSIGALQLIFSFLAGSFTTYVVQRRLQMESERRKIEREDGITMRKNVYGPIFKAISEILEKVELAEYPKQDSKNKLEEIKTHWLFYNMSRDLKSKFYALVDRLDKYEGILGATKTILHNTVRTETEKAYQVDIGYDAKQILLRLQFGEIVLSQFTMLQSLLQNITPRQFVREETKRWGKNISTNVLVAGKKSNNIKEFEVLYEKVLDKIKREPVYQEEKKQRQALVKELEMFLDQIKDFITVQ